MSSLEGIAYVAGAAAYALAVTAAGGAAGRLAGLRAGWRGAALAVSALFVVFLAIHPFPDLATLDCTGGGVPPMMTPFGSLVSYPEFWAARRPPGDWLTSRAIVAPVMNVVLFMLPGAALALLTGRWGVAALFGAGLTLFNETAQLTALYGLYPCRYRYVSVDDLMFNTLGVLLGFGAGRVLWRPRNRQRR
jgi:hypothetical protein